jgi:hypothetical protein
MQSTQEQDHCIKIKHKRISQGTSQLVLLTLDKMSMFCTISLKAAVLPGLISGWALVKKKK